MSEFDSHGFYIETNWLRAPSGHYLRTTPMTGLNADKRWEIQPDELGELIAERRDMFNLHIEAYYLDTLRRNEGKGLTIGRPSIWLAQLGSEQESERRWSKVFSEKGYKNGGIIKAIDELSQPYRAYWQAVLDGGEGAFNPEVRRVSGKALGGAWLLLELDESKL